MKGRPLTSYSVRCRPSLAKGRRLFGSRRCSGGAACVCVGLCVGAGRSLRRVRLSVRVSCGARPRRASRTECCVFASHSRAAADGRNKLVSLFNSHPSIHLDWRRSQFVACRECLRANDDDDADDGNGDHDDDQLACQRAGQVCAQLQTRIGPNNSVDSSGFLFLSTSQPFGATLSRRRHRSELRLANVAVAAAVSYVTQRNATQSNVTDLSDGACFLHCSLDGWRGGQLRAGRA